MTNPPNPLHTVLWPKPSWVSAGPRIGERPLEGIRMLEVGGVGPLPFFGMLMADLGADIVRIDPPVPDLRSPRPNMFVFRGRRSIAIDVRDRAGLDVLLRLADTADVLVEGFRPGVAERLGFGPEDCRNRNRHLIYGRMTGWGGDGPLAEKAGHDINYIALSGALHAIGPADRPPSVPLNLIGDYGGGAMMLTMGVLAALFERTRTGHGHVVEAAMLDGAISLMSHWYMFRALGMCTDDRSANLVDGAAPFYNTYATGDGKYIAVGAVEKKFYAQLLDGLGLDPELAETQMDRSAWPSTRARFAELFRQRTRDEWESVFADRDACATPVLAMGEAPSHPHNVSRANIVTLDGHIQTAPPVRFDGTSPRIPEPAPALGEHTDAILAQLGFDDAQVRDLRSRQVVA
jgi:alpha-methylacyl-CoA racemase